MTQKFTVRKTLCFSKDQWEYIRKRAYELDISPNEWVRRVVEEIEGQITGGVLVKYPECHGYKPIGEKGILLVGKKEGV